MTWFTVDMKNNSTENRSEKCLFSPSDCWSVTAAVIRWSYRQVCVKSETSTTRGGLENNKNDHWLCTIVYLVWTTRTTHGFLSFFQKAELLRSRYWRRENKVMAARPRRRLHNFLAGITSLSVAVGPSTWAQIESFIFFSFPVNNKR